MWNFITKFMGYFTTPRVSESNTMIASANINEQKPYDTPQLKQYEFSANITPPVPPVSINEPIYLPNYNSQKSETKINENVLKLRESISGTLEGFSKYVQLNAKMFPEALAALEQINPENQFRYDADDMKRSLILAYRRADIYYRNIQTQLDRIMQTMIRMS